MARKETEHRFGGEWTERKLAVITRYAEMYQKVLTLSARGFVAETWYIDAFAGTGDRLQEIQKGGVHEGTTVESEGVHLQGSARLILGVNPPFQHYRLIESMKGKSLRLKILETEYPDRDVRCVRADGNDYIQELFSHAPWSDRYHAHRALVFLDPYGLAVHWETLEALARCKSADVWLFFNFDGLNRQIANSTSKVDLDKRASVTRMFGNEDWLQAFYAPSRQSNLLDVLEDERVTNRTAIIEYAVARYKKIYCYVADPIPITVSGRGVPFALFCMSNNPSVKAQDAIARIVKSVKQLAVKASRHTFSP